ncbi:MAG: recombinase family protein [Pelosinus sp.]|nr:recombinase family protein [Pelosinus sp.]
MQKERYVAIYIRVSTAEQVDGHSLKGQEAETRADVQARGKFVYKVYQDAGVSGAAEDRKGLNALLHDAKEGYFGEVLVWTVSRISRKLSFLLKVVEVLKAEGIAFRSISEQFDVTTPIGQFALTMMGAVAQMQRESWMESSHIGMQKRAKSGRWGGGMMLGYQMVPEEEDPRGGGKLVIVEAEAEIVKRIFAMYAEGMGYKTIASRLNEEGKVGKTGASFTVSTIHDILINAVYVGKVRFGDEYYAGIHPPLVSSELWEIVQQTINRRSKPVKKKIDHEYLLSGVLKCPVCHSGMIPMHTKGKRSDGTYRYNYYYVCSAYLNKGSAVCKSNLVVAEESEHKVLIWLMQFFTSPFWLEKVTYAIQKRMEAINKPILYECKQVEQHLVRIERCQSELLRRYENDLISKDSFLAEAQRLKNEKAGWQGQLTTNKPVTTTMASWSKEDIQGAFRSFQRVLMQASADKKRHLIRNLFSRIVVNDKRQVAEVELNPMPVIADVKNGSPISWEVAI